MKTAILYAIRSPYLVLFASYDFGFKFDFQELIFLNVIKFYILVLL